MFDNNDTVFINWIENLESRCQELIYSKREAWFETKLEKDDIESAFTSPFKIFKSGKYYLLRVNVKQNIKIYDEHDQIINSDDITSDKTIISILEIQGIKFTSRNFQIEVELKQAMVVSPDPFLDECFIKKPAKRQPVKEAQIEEPEEKEEKEEKEENEIKETTNLDDFINKSANDLAKNVKTLDNKHIPIDLEVSFDKKEVEPKPIVVSSTNVLDELEEANIVLDIEELDPEEPEPELEDPNILKEVDLSATLENNLESITLKKPNQVYYEIYQKAREKAKEAKKSAIVAYLEMKNIKKTYMLDDIDESDSEFENFSGRDSASEVSDAESLEDTFD
jgi:hypothetical protein